MSLPTPPSGGSSPTRPAFVDSAPAEARFGRFVRVEKLGRGGMGEVWKAWDVELGRWVALKFLLGEDGDEIARFKREAQTAGRLNHPNIAAIYEVGQANDRHFIAMQFVAGQTLKTAPRSDRREVTRVVRDAAVALQYAHDQGVVHRDLKPENLMVTPQGHVYVMDFGLARSVEGAQSMSGMAVGTPAYMPPEQARGQRADARSDVYGLGAALYELVADRPPFRGDDVYSLLMKVIDEEPKRPRALDPAIDPDLETIVLKCLEKEPERRYASAGDLGADLDRWLRGDEISARAPSIWYRLRKRAARRKGVFVAGLIALAALATGAAFGIAQLWKRQELELTVTPAVERARELARSADAMLYRESFDEAAWEAKLAEAQSECLRALSKRDGYAPGHLVLGLVKRQRGDIDGALESFGAAIARNPGYAQAHLERAKTYAEKVFEIEHMRPGGDIDVEARRLEQAWADRARADLGLATGAEAEEAMLARLVGLFLAGGDVLSTVEGSRSGGDERIWRIAGEAEHRAGRFASAARCYEEYLAVRRGDAEGWSRLAHLKRDGGDVKASMELAERALRLRRRLPSALVNRGRSRQELGEHDGALADYDAALAQRPPDGDALVCRATARAHRGEFDAAIADCEAALRLNARDRYALFNRALCLRDKKEWAASIADFNRILEIDPGFTQAQSAKADTKRDHGDLEGALADYEEAIRRGGEGLAAAWAGRGGLRADAGDVKGALDDLDRSIIVNPKQARARADRGRLRMLVRDVDGAIEDLTAAIELDPRITASWANRCLAWRAKGDYPRAVADGDHAVKLSPLDSGARVNRGLAREGLGNLRGALEDYEEAIRLDPKNAEAYSNRGNVRFAEQDLEGALEDQDRALQLDPRLAPAYNSRAYIRFLKKDRDGAMSDLNEAIRLDPMLPSPRLNRGHLNQSLGHLEEAEQDYTVAMKLDPRDATPVAQRGLIRGRRGEKTAAIADLKAALKLGPEPGLKAAVERALAVLEK